MNVFIIAALSADGFIAKSKEHPANWTSKEDKAKFVELTKKAGVMVMGRTTFDTIGKALPGRRTIVYTNSNRNIEGVESTSESPKALLGRLEREGHNQVAIVGGQSIYDLFYASGLVDELYLTIEPVIFGNGIKLFKSDIGGNISLLQEEKLNDDTLFLHYKVEK